MRWIYLPFILCCYYIHILLARYDACIYVVVVGKHEHHRKVLTYAPGASLHAHLSGLAAAAGANRLIKREGENESDLAYLTTSFFSLSLSLLTRSRVMDAKFGSRCVASTAGFSPLSRVYT